MGKMDIGIRKMARQLDNYFCYLPTSPQLQAWGVWATAVGYTQVKPGSAYPPARHPGDHHFTWTQGRILDCFQVVYLTRGGGQMQWQQDRVPLSMGDVFFVFPGVWHRYSPDPDTGWTEHWIELRGPVIDNLLANGVFTAQQPKVNVGLHPELRELFDRCHLLTRTRPEGFELLLGPVGMQILAQIQVKTRHDNHSETQPLRHAVRKAQQLLSKSSGQQNLQALADELGVDYTAFRRAFKEHVGLSPGQYALAHRLRRAQDLLRHTDASIQLIADTLGYSSPYHFSADFSARTGLPPSQWRAENRRMPVEDFEDLLSW